MNCAVTLLLASSCVLMMPVTPASLPLVIVIDRLPCGKGLLIKGGGACS